ncbi:MAG: SRPBCC family protein [Jatrophihabitans sp.]
MVDIHHEGFAEAPLSVAFAYIDDTSNVPDWMFGISKFHAVDPANDHGLGAVYEGIFEVRPVKLKSVVEVTAWELDVHIELTSIKGFKNSSTWRFTAAGPTRTKLQVTFSYELPGGLAGRALGRVMEPIVALSVRHSDAALRKHIEAAYVSGG